jgi:hypothetical protein
MGGFRHFVSVNKMKDGNMAESIPVLSKWLLLIDTKLTLVGEYSGNGVNVSFKSVENSKVNL